jgi:hypothetical protein
MPQRGNGSQPRVAAPVPLPGGPYPSPHFQPQSGLRRTPIYKGTSRHPEFESPYNTASFHCRQCITLPRRLRRPQQQDVKTPFLTRSTGRPGRGGKTGSYVARLSEVTSPISPISLLESAFSGFPSSCHKMVLSLSRPSTLILDRASGRRPMLRPGKGRGSVRAPRMKHNQLNHRHKDGGGRNP